MRYTLGLDLGTSSLKALLLGEDGVVAANATRGYEMRSPYPGWAEQDPEHWWTACLDAIHALLSEARIDGASVAAVCAGGQMHGTVLLDRDGALARPAIIWPDGRAGVEAAAAEAALQARGLLPRLGGGVSPGFMAATLLWCLAHEPAVWARVHSVLLPKDYLRYQLTGMLASDPSDGSGIPAIDLDTGNWSLAALEALGIAPALLPPLVESAAAAGVVTERAAAASGLHAGTPVLSGGSDQAMAAIGAGLLNPGALLISISTGGQIVTPLTAPLAAPDYGLRTVCHALPSDRRRTEPDSSNGDSDRSRAVHPSATPRFGGGYLALSATLGAGLSMRWLREQVFGESSDAPLLAAAATAPAGAGGLLFLPYLAGERAPILDPLASGALVGMRLEHGRGHLARAVLEGIACSLRHALEPLAAAGVRTEQVIVAGGLARTALMREILAAVLDRPLQALASAEQSALGAALLGAVHAGFWPSLEAACAAAVSYQPAIAADAAGVDRYQALYARYRALYPALRAAMHELRTQV